MKFKPRAIIVSGYGFNTEEETVVAFGLAGITADIVHVNDLIARKEILARYQILVVPGGFSYGDDTGRGKAFAAKLQNHLSEELARFAQKDHLVIGICNGFQVLVQFGLLPGFQGSRNRRHVALLHNNSVRYTARWTDVRVVNDSPWLRHVHEVSLPIAHGEGRLYASRDTLKLMKKNHQIALMYYKGDISTYQDLPANPTGTIENIAGITDPSGRILGMMPHPERAIFFTQRPDWPLLREMCIRASKPVPTFGPGMAIFRNAGYYFL